jgi:hypothetical protein
MQRERAGCDTDDDKHKQNKVYFQKATVGHFSSCIRLKG